MDAGPATTSADSPPRVDEVLRRYWGFDSLRPLQREAIEAGLAQRDSLVVLPTGGGKSLCYQVPPAIAGRTDIIISPLISLMKDQVDALRTCGYPAAAIHSNLTPQERREIREGVSAGQYHLIFVSPERLATDRFLAFLDRLDVRAFAIDEAHCISHWGHDFRPEYRKLAMLKSRFPRASVHAYTATATERVQRDIIKQLGLDDPRVLIGRFDRPNLVYRIVPRTDTAGQVVEILRRHPKEACIVYCISRKDTEWLAATLRANGINAEHYHAGMEKRERTKTQDAFAAERIDVVVATVAFGMGIDRSDVRCVIHAAMPKSIEHYQQETGRAGRDGLEAECIMLYSVADAIRWEELLAKSFAEAENRNEEELQAQLELIGHMKRYCGSLECRHRALSRYFGQHLESANCGACDVCLDEIESMAESTVTAQKILSCVARLRQSFGVQYVAQVLRGAETELIHRRGHDELSTYGLLPDLDEKSLMNLVFQLVDQGLLDRTPGDRPVLRLNGDSLAVLRGEREVHLIEPSGGLVRKSKHEEESWENVSRPLFEHLRALRREISQDQGVPAFVIFDDRTLRELARVRPTTIKTMGDIRGIGETKLKHFGPDFTNAIKSFCDEHELDTDVITQLAVVRTKRMTTTNPQKEQALAMIEARASIAEIAAKTGRATSTVSNYLAEWIERERPADIRAWVDDQTYKRVVEAAMIVETQGALKPIFDHLNAEVPYDAIRLVIAHQRAIHS